MSRDISQLHKMRKAEHLGSKKLQKLIPLELLDVVTAAQEKVLEFVRKNRSKLLKTIQKAYSGTSYRKALNAKCLECSNFQINEVRECMVYTCPLWMYRPYQKDSGTGDPNSDCTVSQNG